MNKQTKYLSILIAIAFLLSACGSATATATPIPLPTDSPTATYPFLPTLTPKPILSPTASITPIPTIATFTPTFDVRTIVTVTPATAAICPTVSQNSPDGLDFDLSRSNNLDEINHNILEYLNNGGSPESIVKKVRTKYYQSTDIQPERQALEKDITGDGVPELLIAPLVYVSIFRCEDGKYRILFTLLPESVHKTDIRAVSDANKNGVPEIYIYINECMGGRCNRLVAIEWNGIDFQSMILDPYNHCNDISEPFELDLRDIDQDSLPELILAGRLPIVPDDLLFPYRKETSICKWNGQGFDFYRKEFSGPTYRFQALQDADLAAIQGEYEKAINFYQKTIFDESLEWWSVERRFYEYEMLTSSFYHANPTPTLSPSLIPDSTEYSHLAAYAYFRMTALHIYLGAMDGATIQYNTLQQKFPADSPGHPYVEMATAFWNAYQSSANITTACAAAIQYAAEHPEILVPLGSNYHGYQSRWYVPADVCPFR